MKTGFRRSAMLNKFKRGSAMASPLSPAPVAKTLRYSEACEHLLRRLGSALVLQWDELPDALQDLLIDQAVLVEDRDEADHAREDIERFLRTVRSAPLSPLAQASLAQAGAPN